MPGVVTVIDQQRVEDDSPAQRQSFNRLLPRDVEEIGGEHQPVDDLDVARERADGKADRRDGEARHDDEKEEVLKVWEHARRQDDHARRAESLEQQKRQREAGLAADQHEEVAEEFSEQVKQTAAMARLDTTTKKKKC